MGDFGRACKGAVSAHADLYPESVGLAQPQRDDGAGSEKLADATKGGAAGATETGLSRHLAVADQDLCKHIAARAGR